MEEMGMNSRILWNVALAVLPTIALAGCAQGDDSICSPGSTQSCGCTTTTGTGNQVCNSDGSGWGPCLPCNKAEEDGSDCHPDCWGKECGDNGCGGSCGSCDGQYYCSVGQCIFDCPPICAGKECGDDGCGGSCGSCGAGESCQGGKCVKGGPICPVDKDCSGKQCGIDPVCGESCGDCGGIKICNDNAKCVDSGNYVSYSLNGSTVWQTGFSGYGASGWRDVSSDTADAGFMFGSQLLVRVIVLDLLSAEATTYGCEGVPMNVSYCHADLKVPWTGDAAEAFPLAWRNWGYGTNTGCGEYDVDTILDNSFVLSTVSSDALKGSFSVTVKGGGPRADDMMVISGKFDIGLEAR